MAKRGDVLWVGLLLSLSCLGTGCEKAAPPPCPGGMAFVEGGVFLTGAPLDEMDIAPMAHGLGFLPRAPGEALVGDVCMDQYEFPNIPGAMPRINITFTDAEAACRAQGKRLCTELEFERACGGWEGWPAPYGPHVQVGRCNADAVDGVGDSERWLAPSGSFEECVSPEGIFDLEGNVSEWVYEDLGRDHGQLMEGGGDATARMMNHRPEAVVRGGTMWVGIYGAGCHARHFHVADGPTSPDDGFRCCMDVPKSPELSKSPKAP